MKRQRVGYMAQVDLKKATEDESHLYLAELASRLCDTEEQVDLRKAWRGLNREDGKPVKVTISVEWEE